MVSLTWRYQTSMSTDMFIAFIQKRQSVCFSAGWLFIFASLRSDTKQLCKNNKINAALSTSPSGYWPALEAACITKWWLMCGLIFMFRKINKIFVLYIRMYWFKKIKVVVSYVLKIKTGKLKCRVNFENHKTKMFWHMFTSAMTGMTYVMAHCDI